MYIVHCRVIVDNRCEFQRKNRDKKSNKNETRNHEETKSLQNTCKHSKTCFQEQPERAICVQLSSGSLNHATQNCYFTSPHPSWLFDPRHPSSKKTCFSIGCVCFNRCCPASRSQDCQSSGVRTTSKPLVVEKASMNHTTYTVTYPLRDSHRSAEFLTCATRSIAWVVFFRADRVLTLAEAMT